MSLLQERHLLMASEDWRHAFELPVGHSGEHSLNTSVINSCIGADASAKLILSGTLGLCSCWDSYCIASKCLLSCISVSSLYFKQS